MKKHVVCLFAVFGAFLPSRLSAQAPQLNLSVEIYEMPNASAFAVQKVFATGTEAQRKALAQKLREKSFPGGFKSLVILKGNALVGQRISLGTPTEKRYATEFTTGAAAPAPTAYQVRKLGWMAEFEATMSKDAVRYDFAAAIQFTQQDGSAHFRLTGGGQTGNMEQPYFAGQKCVISGTVSAGEPELAAIYTPFREGLPATSLGVIILTVSPTK